MRENRFEWRSPAALEQTSTNPGILLSDGTTRDCRAILCYESFAKSFWNILIERNNKNLEEKRKTPQRNLQSTPKPINNCLLHTQFPAKIPSRFNVAVMLFMACFTSYMLRTNISINLIAMVQDTNNSTNSSLPDVRENYVHDAIEL